MSITPYLDEFDADPETKRVLAVALEMTRVSLGLTDDLADGIIAKQIVELAKTGERNPYLLCEAALKKLHEHLYSWPAGRGLAIVNRASAPSEIPVA
jgi:hypothetical protein